MKQSEIFRENAENCLRLAETAKDEPTYHRYRRMADAWLALAEEQDWLDGEKSPAAAYTISPLRSVILRSAKRVSKDERPGPGPCTLRGSLRSHLRMTD